MNSPMHHDGTLYIDPLFPKSFRARRGGKGRQGKAEFDEVEVVVF